MVISSYPSLNPQVFHAAKNVRKSLQWENSKRINFEIAKTNWQLKMEGARKDKSR